MLRFTIPASVLLAAAALPATAQTLVWDYKAYQRDPTSGQYSKDRYVTASIRLEEKDGKASFRMIYPGRGDPCTNQGELPADVERTADTLIITVRPALAGCAPFRYVIRNDGSGGERQNPRGERWVSDGLDHGLTPKK